MEKMRQISVCLPEEALQRLERIARSLPFDLKLAQIAREALLKGLKQLEEEIKGFANMLEE